jgi:hypothetical protein
LAVNCVGETYGKDHSNLNSPNTIVILFIPDEVVISAISAKTDWSGGVHS